MSAIPIKIMMNENSTAPTIKATRQKQWRHHRSRNQTPEDDVYTVGQAGLATSIDCVHNQNGRDFAAFRSG
jgi:hypothetical protein